MLGLFLLAANNIKKRKRGSEVAPDIDVDTSKPTALFQPCVGRLYTLSIALPGSIVAKYDATYFILFTQSDDLSSAQSHDLKTALAGQIARALAVFCVDEVVVFDDNAEVEHVYGDVDHVDARAVHNAGTIESYTGNSNPNYFLMHLLSYLETPPYLRKHLFPIHPDLRTAGTLPSLDMPHHLRTNEWCKFREGITMKSILQPASTDMKKPKELTRKKKKQKFPTEPLSVGTEIYTGLFPNTMVQAHIPPNTRVTVRLPESSASVMRHNSSDNARVVAGSTPREEAGYYWGYSTRPASSLSDVITECPFDGGYDLTFGTSERGIPISTLESSPRPPLPRFRHMLIVFGGVAGLEASVKTDAALQSMGVTRPEELFDYWVNLCEAQGSRTIRTEEAVWLGLMGLRGIVLSKGIN